VAVYAILAVLIIAAVVVVLIAYRRHSKPVSSYDVNPEKTELGLMGASKDPLSQLEWDDIDESHGNGTQMMVETQHLGRGHETRASQKKYIEDRLSETEYREPLYREEFNSMDRKKPSGSFRSAGLDQNRPKNRYRDILPYDDTRVRLSTDADSDYINANHISVEAGRSTLEYIASQGPLTSTTGDFWRMVWEQKARIVCMVASEQEKGKTKCARYWPTKEGDAGQETFGIFEVTMKRFAENTAYCIRGLQVRNLETGERRTVWHLQYTSWPDHGVPDDSSLFLAYVDECRTVRERIAKKLPGTYPTVVHCSAGIGRSGCLIVIEVCLNRVSDGQLPDVHSVLKQCRDQRPAMVQTLDQYKFCYTAILDALKNDE
jgi:tyrosine-protein phosphatase non-receptor type 14/21